ncbi:anti-anti-sigma regulatory factor (antagonist of anti-sigma factor) [Acidovorax sp. CF316]|uniref:STAS domain-containing protein n=1 Tax=Acidovorax sp. CF316 TaxID=1144317 RepID=UPI00026BE53B|nr:STAS domain-containing protein [Acidovorax sp. CF316]EJE50995.1 anti-anti-sigma regulatory factor (antagonist of anti-sigma factor) [Acidovorax sp. CF316]
MNTQSTQILDALQDDKRTALVQEWIEEAKAGNASLPRSATADAGEVALAMAHALRNGASIDSFTDPKWSALQQVLSDLSRSGAAQGQSVGETSVFVLALKKPLLTALHRREGIENAQLASAFWSVTKLVDGMAQFTATTFQRAREEIITRQQEELLELSTPVVKLWEGVLAVPMIGTLDSNRTQIVMETLLQKIVDTGSELAIIDITGVPTVDTLVAQHLLKTVTAIRLMGADCIISGIRPQIAQTIVHLGIDLQGISTKASLADALSLALQRTGWRITRQAT